MPTNVWSARIANDAISLLRANAGLLMGAGADVTGLNPVTDDDRSRWADNAAALFDALPEPPAPDVNALRDRRRPFTQTGPPQRPAKGEPAAPATRETPDLGGWAKAVTRTGSPVRQPNPQATDARTAPPDPIAPLDYEHTVTGLAGIPITHLAAVTDRAAAGFDAAGLNSLYDLLMHVPLRYLDRSTRTPIADLTVGESGTTIATVTDKTTGITRNGMRYAKFTLRDNSATLSVMFMHAQWMVDRFDRGDEVVVMGTLKAWQANSGHTSLSMTNPLMDRTGSTDTPIVPVYPQSGTTRGAKKKKAALTTYMIHRAAMETVARMGHLSDPIPEQLLTSAELLDRTTAYRHVHNPPSMGQETAARRRLAYDELVRMQLALGMRRHQAASTASIAHRPTGALTSALRGTFPYSLTGSQERAIATIETDLRRKNPMHRLLQGDVGYGKSVVAAMTLLMGLESGSQGALMAPTEILATQLFNELAQLTAGLTHHDGRPVTVRALTNKVRTKARRETLAGLADGTVDVLVGTHALLSDDVIFRSLGVVVVDEQHRFGVEQRATLRGKGPNETTPDMLVMTATPIPRTAAMTVFGDLDVTVLDEAPPGRTPVDTRWINAAPDYSNRDDPVWTKVRYEAAQGHQAYVVCPLVEESETRSAAAATETAEALTAGALSGLRVAVVHGKMKAAERDPVVESFRAGEIDVLVATTVIEVGVSVPNATMIVILDPKQFGLAQLHQLRGRVGRGTLASWCVLYGEVSDDGAARMNALCSTTDGFKLSETDLKLRGPGAILGARQSGLSDLRVASLATDTELLNIAREHASTLLANDVVLQRRPALYAEVMMALGEDGQDWLTRG